MLRRASPWLLFVALMALGYAQFGALLRFEHERAAIQRAIKLRLKAGVPEEELTTFTLTAEQWRGLRWVKPGREFRLPDGRMFDVVRRADGPDGTVVLRCIADHEETALFAGLKEAVARGMDGRAPRSRERVVYVVLHLARPPEGVVLPERSAGPQFWPQAPHRMPADGWITDRTPTPERPAHG